MVKERAHATLARLAHAVAMDEGVPEARALQLVRAVVAAMREDVATSQRFVLPGLLVIERAPPTARKRHRVRFVLHERAKAAERIARYRAARA